VGRTSSFLIAVTAALAACGSDGDAEPAVGEVDDFLTELAVAGCENLAECPMARNSQATFQAMVLASPAGCRDWVTSARRARVGYARLVADGAVTFDAAAGQRCLTEFREHCEEWTFENLAPCREVFTGTVAIGGTCDTDAECAGDAYCDNAPGRQCPGTCAARVAIGEQCSFDEACSTAAGPAACSVGACAPLTWAVAEPGAACGELGDLDHKALTACPDGYFCDNASTVDAPRTCVARTPRGAPCDPGEDLCAEQGDICLPVDDGDPVCRPATVLDAGAACTPALSTSDTVCSALDRLACIDGTCASVGDGRDGSLCGDAVIAGCATGFGCVDGVCRPLLDDGTACTDDAQCSGYCDGVCRPGC